MEFEENEIYEVLGVTPPAEPEGHEDPAGEVGPEGIAPAGDAPEEEQNEGTAEPSRGAAAGGLSAKSSAKRSFTEQEAEEELEPDQEPAREEAERAQQEAIQRAVAEAVSRERERAQEEWREFFSRAGLRNSVSGEAITSREEFEAWYRSYEAEKISRELKEGKLTPEALDAAVRNSLRRSGNHAQQQENGNHPDGERQVTQADIDRELAEIHRMDGSVNGLEDILKLETGPAFRDAVRRGHSFLDAFKLANFDRLQQQRQAEAARRAAQAARNNAASKEHLKSSAAKGSGSTPVPGDVMEMYRVMMPGATEAEITAHYNRMLKDMKM